MIDKDSYKWDKIYNEQDPQYIPWNFEEVPVWFKEVIESGWVGPCKALDIGCGLGTYSNYLAQKGFDVLGIDFSDVAIKKNKNKYNLNNLKFENFDALDLKFLDDKFPFVIDISLFHNIAPKERIKYIESLLSVTQSGSKILLCCFSDKEMAFEGKDKFYNLELDITSQILSEASIREIFEKHFKIEKIEELKFGKIIKFNNSIERKRHLVFMNKP